MIDWVIGVVILSAVVAIIIKKGKDAKEGKTGCGCSCTGCSKKGQCH